jgi:hypothetical protein
VNEKASGDADMVEIFNLKGLSPISELIVRYKGTNNTSTPTEHPAKLITQIQVIDGSEVILDLDGKQANALGYYHYKQPMVNGMSYIDNNQCWVTCRLPFGKWLWDPMLALDPARFNNLQVIVKTDHDAGGSAPDAGYLDIVANVFDGKKITPIGYLKAREHYRYIVVASGVETVDLPVDLPIKMLMFQGDLKDTALIQQINKIKLSEDLDTKVVLDHSTSDIIKMLGPDIAPWVEKVRCNGTTGAVEHFFTQFYELVAILGGIMATPNYASVTPSEGGTADMDSAAAGECDIITSGYCPHGCVAIEFGDPWDHEDWYDLRNAKSLKAYLTAGASAGATGYNKVIVQQLKKY